MAFERAWKGNQVPSAKHIIQYKTKRNWSENILFLKSGVNQHFRTKPTLRGSCLSLEIFREDKNGVGSILLYFFLPPFPHPGFAALLHVPYCIEHVAILCFLLGEVPHLSFSEVMLIFYAIVWDLTITKPLDFKTKQKCIEKCFCYNLSCPTNVHLLHTCVLTVRYLGKTWIP